MTVKKGRPPVGGYGIKSKRLTTTIRLPLFLHKWLMKQSNVAKFIRKLLLNKYEREK